MPTVQVPIPTVQVPVPTVQVPVPVPTVQVPIPVPKVPVPTAPPTGGGGGGAGGGRRRSGGSGGVGRQRRRLGRQRRRRGQQRRRLEQRWHGQRVRLGRRLQRRRQRLQQRRDRQRRHEVRERQRRQVIVRAPLVADRSGGAHPRRRPTCAGRARSSGSGACARPSPGRPAASTTSHRASGACFGSGPGVGERPARSRTNVAKRLDISVKRVARLETTGLRRLRTLAEPRRVRDRRAQHRHGRRGHDVHRHVRDQARPGRSAAPTRAAGVPPAAARAIAPPPAVSMLPAPGNDGGVRGATQSNRPAASKAGGLDLTCAADPARWLAGLAFAVGRAALKRELAPRPLAEPRARARSAAGPQPELGRPPPGRRRLIACKTARFALARAVQP